jgi:hypothetical protein
MSDPLEESLRQVLHRRAGEVDTGRPVRPLDLSTHPSGQPQQVGRTWLAAVGSAAAVLAIIVGALIGLRGVPGEPSPLRPASPLTSTTSHPTPTPPAPTPATTPTVPAPVPGSSSDTTSPSVAVPTTGTAPAQQPTPAG